MKNKNIIESKDYFTDDVREAVNNMSNGDMRDLLKALLDTPTWFAILKYNQDRIGTIQGSFLVLDPLKEASKISQYQGVVTGMLDLQDAVITLNLKAKKAEDPKYKENQDIENNGGAYGVI